MRAREILDEDYNQNLESDVTNLLISVKGAGGTVIPTQKLIDKLNSSGYSVSVESLMGLLQDIPLISSITPAQIQFAPSDAMPGVSDDTETPDSSGEESDMSQQATNIK